MCRSSWETVPITANEHVHTKDNIYFPRCRVGEPRIECSPSTASGGTKDGWEKQTVETNPHYRGDEKKKKKLFSGDLKKALKSLLKPKTKKKKKM